MKTSAVIVCYNNLELCQDTIQSVTMNLTGDAEVILVDNHALDSRTRSYINGMKEFSYVKVVDPGGNVGTHRGFNAGFEVATGDYLMKIDDDVKVLTPGFNEKLINALDTWNKEDSNYPMAFIAPDSNVKQVTNTAPAIRNRIHYDIVLSGVLGFSMMMMPRSTYELFGPLECKFWGDGEIKKDSRYGGEELYFCTLAQQHRMCYGYCNDVKIHHADNEFRDPLYPAWKWGYGYRSWFTGDLSEFRDSNEHILMVCQDWLNTDNPWYRETALKIMEKIKQTGKAY